MNVEMKAGSGGRQKKNVEMMKRKKHFKATKSKTKRLLKQIIEDDDMYVYRFAYMPVTGNIMGISFWNDEIHKEVRAFIHPGRVEVVVYKKANQVVSIEEAFELIKNELDG